MTPYQLEDMYKSGSVPLITSDSPAVANKTDDSEPPLSSLRAVNQPNTIPITSSRPSHRGSTMPLDNLLMGFGFPSLSQSKATPFLPHSPKPAISKGSWDPDFLEKATFTTLNVMAMEGQPPAFWDVTFDGAIVNGQRLQLSSTIATIDTGTSVIGVPQEDARAIYASVPGAASSGGGQYTYPCQSIHSFLWFLAAVNSISIQQIVRHLFKIYVGNLES
ncbi:hypothetical protein KEM48_014480 [Puccinia striiformis f. sp. tritici PST-130]|nr:hypothetical protein KEM48_014480 [Puccinia striiformis f. sp. tritici PST-130]